MARYTGPMTKKSRRLGVDLIGGDSSYERRPYPPGQHGRGRIAGEDRAWGGLGAGFQRNVHLGRPAWSRELFRSRGDLPARQ